MVEQVTINPTEVRGYGNICEGHTLEDFIVSNSGLAKEKEDVHGALTSVYRLVYSLYGLMFYFDKGNKQLYLQTAEADTLSFGFDEESKQLYLVDEEDTGFSLGFDEDTNELYITDDAPPVVHNYSLALDSDSYTTTGSLSVSATLLDDGVAVEGATVSFSGGVSTVTATTNSNGVATATVTFSASGTLTATYSNVSDTASVTVQSYLFYDACDSASGLTNYGSLVSLESATSNANLTYDSTENAYALTSLGAIGAFPITPLNGLDNFKLSFEFRTPSTTQKIGLGLTPMIPSTHTGITFFINQTSSVRESVIEIAKNNSETYWGNGQTITGYDTSKYYKLELIIDGDTATWKLYDYNSTLLRTYNHTLSNITTDYNTLSNRAYGIAVGYQNNSSVKMYIKNIVAEYI